MLAHALSLLYSRRDCRNNVTRSRLRRTIAVPSRRSPLLTIPAGSTISQGMLTHALSLLYSRRDCRNNVTRSRLRRTIAVPSRRSPLLTIPAGSTISQGMLTHALSLLSSRRGCRNNGTRSRLRRTIAVPSRRPPLLTIPAGSTGLTTKYCGLFLFCHNFNLSSDYLKFLSALCQVAKVQLQRLSSVESRQSISSSVLTRMTTTSH